jgi:tetratricopeptide (TPR) repeat protein
VRASANASRSNGRAPHGACGLGYVYWSLGQAHLGVGAVAEAQAWLDEGLQVAHDSGFENLIGYLLDELARVHLALGDSHRADVTFRRSLELALANGDAMLEARVRSGYGRAALADGRDAEARDRLRAAASAARRHGCYPFAMEAIEGLADLDVREARLADGVSVLAFIRASPLAAPAMVRSVEAKLERLRERIGEEEFSEACRRGLVNVTHTTIAVNRSPDRTRSTMPRLAVRFASTSPTSIDASRMRASSPAPVGTQGGVGTGLDHMARVTAGLVGR